MDPEREGAYEAVPLQCFACAAREAEGRQAGKERAAALEAGSSGEDFDGLYFAVREREEVPGV